MANLLNSCADRASRACMHHPLDHLPLEQDRHNMGKLPLCMASLLVAFLLLHITANKAMVATGSKARVATVSKHLKLVITSPREDMISHRSSSQEGMVSHRSSSSQEGMVSLPSSKCNMVLLDLAEVMLAIQVLSFPFYSNAHKSRTLWHFTLRARLSPSHR